MMLIKAEFFDKVYFALMQNNIGAKISALYNVTGQWHDGVFLSKEKAMAQHADLDAVLDPGRPSKPILVAPAKLKSRGLGSEKGRAGFVHAIAHIEFNAINLALDALYRFRDLPPLYYENWLQVANEEAKHFQLLNARLVELGYEYGDFPAHNGLWDMAQQTRRSLLARMALIPMVFEARGLDVTPDMIYRLEQVGDTKTADILRIILEEEVGHVAFGRYWFNYECERQHLNKKETLIHLVKEYMPGKRLGPFNYEYRQAAGFVEDELAELERLN